MRCSGGVQDLKDIPVNRADEHWGLLSDPANHSQTPPNLGRPPPFVCLRPIPSFFSPVVFLRPMPRPLRPEPLGPGPLNRQQSIPTQLGSACANSRTCAGRGGPWFFFGTRRVRWETSHHPISSSSASRRCLIF